MGEKLGIEEKCICILTVPEDAALAKTLKKSIQRYRLPGDIHVPERDIYKKVQLLEVPQIAQEDSSSLQEELLGARVILLMCSPDSKENPLFQECIRSYKEKGGNIGMIPVMVRGEPEDSMPEDFIEERLVEVILPDKSIGQRLEKIEPIAADLRALGERNQRKVLRYETVRIVASVLKLHPNYLEKRQEKRGQRMALMGCSLAAFVCLACSLLFLYLGAKVKKEGDLARRQLEMSCEVMERTVTDLPASFEGDKEALEVIEEAVQKAQGWLKAQEEDLS